MAYFCMVSQWYDGKQIFITGATGFMGKVLVEKLLRSCNVEKIYVLIRPKREHSAEDRLKEFFSIPLFEKLKLHSFTFLEKVCCVPGDITRTNLGMNEENLNYLKENIDIVFHMAANVKFREPLKNAVLINVGGSYHMLELAKDFKKLSVYVHVSTAYCHVNEKILEEKMYPAPHNPKKVLDIINWLDDDGASIITPYLIKGYPNTYAYTKCLTEELVGQYTSCMRIAVVRPSIVTASYVEPIPGWIDNLNGPTGLMVAGGKGLMRSMLGNSSHVIDLVPVDITVNMMLVVAKELSDRERCVQEPLVVNLTNDTSNSITWKETLAIFKTYIYKNPYSIMLWYPNWRLRSSHFWHSIAVIFFHYLPAYVLDFLFSTFKVKPFLVRTQNRIHKGLDVLLYYSTKAWRFKHKNIYDIYSKLPNNDKETFNCDTSRIIWNDYILSYVLGIRKYVMHEDPTTIPQARNLLFRLCLLDCTIKTGIVCLFILITYSVIIHCFAYFFK